MGRAIDMENELEKLKAKVNHLEKAIKTCIYKVEQFDEFVQDMEDELEEKEENVKKETNSKGDGKGSKSSNKSSGTSKSKNDKS